MRKNLTIWIISSLLILMAAIPLIDGLQFKKHYLASIQTLSQLPEYNKVFQLKVTDYHVGWLHSTATLSITPSNQIPQSNILITQRITHGPLVDNPTLHKITLASAMIHSVIHLPAAYESLILGPNASNGIAHADTMVFFNNHYASHGEITPITLTTQAGNLKWNGIQGDSIINLSTTHQLSYLKTDIALGALSVNSPEGTVSMFPSSIHYEASLKTGELWDSNSTIAVPSLAVNNMKDFNFNLKDLLLTHSANISEEKYLNLIEEISLSQLQIPNFAQGHTTVKLAASYLDAAKIVSTFNENKQQLLNVPDALTANSHFFTPKTTLNADINSDTLFGKLAVNGQAYLPGQSAQPDNDTQALLETMDFQIHVRIATTLLNELIGQFAYLYNPPDNSTLQPVQDSTQQIVNKWVQAGKLSITTANQLKNLEKAHLSPDIYAYGLNQLVSKKVLLPTLAAQLKHSYTTAIQASIMTPLPLTPAESLKQLVSGWVQQGYITQNKDSYLTLITREKGVIKVNNKELPVS